MCNRCTSGFFLIWMCVGRRETELHPERTLICRAVRMGRIHRKFLPGTRIYACNNCHAHLTNHDDIVSKSFQGRTGRAYLFNSVINISLGPTEDRILNTGLHKVCEVSPVSDGGFALCWLAIAKGPGSGPWCRRGGQTCHQVCMR